MEIRDTARFVSLSYFFVLLFGLVLNPIWMTPGFSYAKQVFFVTGVVLFIGGFSFVVYRFLVRAMPQKFGLKLPVNRNSAIFGIVVLVFIGLNLLNVRNGIQNCGDENFLITSALNLRDILWQILFNSPFLGIFAGLSFLGFVIFALFFNILKRRSWVILLFIYLGIFSITVLYLEFFDPEVRSLLSNSTMLVHYSPLSLWLKAPVLVFTKNPDIVLRLYSLILSAASLCVVYLFFRKLYSERSALAAAALYGFSSIFLLYSTSMYLEASYNLFFLLAMFSFFTFLKNDDVHFLGLAVVFANVSFLIKFQGILLLPVFLIAYVVNVFKGARRANLMRDLFFLSLVLVPYLFLHKFFPVIGVMPGNRDLGITTRSFEYLLNFNFIFVYPKMLVEQLTWPVVIMYLSAMYLSRKRDVFVLTGAISLITAMVLAVMDGPYFIGADYGRFIFPVLVFVPCTCGIFLAGVLRRSHFFIVVVFSITLYMVANAFSPQPFERMKYRDNLWYTHKYRPFERQNPRFLPSRELAKKMLELQLSGEKILYLGYFPHETYGRMYGVPATFLTFKDFFDQVPAAQQNAQSLLNYVDANDISYVILPMLNNRYYQEWWYACAFMSFEYGDRPEFIPQVIWEQNQFRTVVTVSNSNGSLYLLRPNH